MGFIMRKFYYLLFLLFLFTGCNNVWTGSFLNPPMDPVSYINMKNEEKATKETQRKNDINPAYKHFINTQSKPEVEKMPNFDTYVFDTNDTSLVLNATKEALNELSFESVFLDNNLNVVQANKLFYKPSRGKMNAKRAAKEISFFAALLFTPISMGASTAILNMDLFENKYITATLSAVLKSDNKVHTKLILFTYDKIDGRDFFGYRTVFAEKEPYNEMYKLIKEKISNKEIK